ncbi:unnamed protein product [Rotaria magnacalcarata]|uniref:Uncharacterized protein n=1 Tax=Rotaria magnacalcarata TaxID=392030 RepID=A0A816QZF2_9BILA|nr:unnamed protein product [Rotaria magnacalcarata]CAF2240021.1 unnamed protein product [Rotaria magnacalcarata]CAF4006713.1 unnamed protein product [Rotaria magnacalcarata]CAF4041329.1 unnamed protein product [Rotaria magnacalcarata]
MRLLELVVPPYKEAYTALQEDVLNPFLRNISTDNEESVSKLVSNLTCAVQFVRNAINSAVNGSNMLRIEVDRKVVDAAAAVSAKEREVSIKEGEIQGKFIEIDNVQRQLATAEQGVRDKQQGVASAEHAVRIAQEKLNKARNCFRRRRRRKRFFRRLWRGIRRVFNALIVRPICSIVNAGGIKSAQDTRSNAERHLREAHGQLNQVRLQLASLQGGKANSEKYLRDFQAQLQELQLNLVILRTMYATSAQINHDLKKVTSHITNVWDASVVLYTTINDLINFDLLIGPLNEVCKALTQESLLKNMPVAMVSEEKLALVKQSLDITAKVLPEMPLNTLMSSVNCTA